MLATLRHANPHHPNRPATLSDAARLNQGDGTPGRIRFHGIAGDGRHIVSIPGVNNGEPFVGGTHDCPTVWPSK